MEVKTGKNSNIIVAIGINILFLAMILIFCDIKYEVSDDFVMAGIMSGAYGSGINPHMIFVNVLYGYILSPFYYIFPQVSWYFLSQLLICFMSFSLITYMLLENNQRYVAVMLVAALLLCFGNDAYILVQFTKTATLSVLSGGSVFLWAVFDRRKIGLKVIAAVICLCGTLLRFNSIYLVGMFFVWLIVVEFVKIYREECNRECRRKRMIPIFLSGALLILLAFGMKGIDRIVYMSDSEYRNYWEYNEARAKIVDASDYGYEAYREQLAQIGISENDYRILRTWNFADNEVFSLETMQKVAKILEEYKETVEVSKERILQNIQERNILGYPVCIACIILFLFSFLLQTKKWYLFCVPPILGVGFILYFFVIERVVYRVEYGVFLSVFISMLYFWRTKEELEYYPNLRKASVLISLFIIGLQSVYFLPDRSYQEVDTDSRREYIDHIFYESWNYDARKYRRVVNKDKPENALLKEIESHKENFYFLDFQTTIQTLYYEWSPFQALPVKYFDNTAYFASILTNFPDAVSTLERYQITQPLPDLVKENVYLVDTDYRTLESKIQYLREHYYPNATVELHKTVSNYQIWKVYVDESTEKSRK